MGCFCCLGTSRKQLVTEDYSDAPNNAKPTNFTGPDGVKVDFKVNGNKEDGSKGDQLAQDVKNLNLREEVSQDGKDNGNRAQTFSFKELEAATGNFRLDCFLGEGGFGKVFKGHLDRINQVVAIKQLDPHGLQGIREFVVEVLTLSLADHPNLVKLLGFCAEGEQRLLVYEYMPLGSLENHLLDIRPGRKPLDWNTRMKIAAGAARGLEYLHDKMKPPVIYRDLKCSNILLGEGYHPKLSDFGLAKARPLFRDRKKFSQMVDPLLEGQYPVRGLYQALAIAAMCVQEQPNMRPVIVDVVTALNYLASQKYDPVLHSAQSSRRSSPALILQGDDENNRHILSMEHVTTDRAWGLDFGSEGKKGRREEPWSLVRIMTVKSVIWIGQ
ncbi:hypothetical protein Fmac_022104 [Flemingia macrophylla]|uniref:Protein kinase domain-containing protein n=1 Tax=Flemingia macrophylla TaxID=520843 RepID=A0ABD1LYR8_9FABA